MKNNIKCYFFYEILYKLADFCYNQIMRIVAGKFRGKKITPPKHNIRPTLDMVKQALFTKLQFEVPGSVVLDLFAGSGALGIEAISRGAKAVYFVDKNPKSVALIKQNLASLNLKQNECEIHILNCDFKDALRKVSQVKFDLIIVDPPYESGYYNLVLQLIKQYGLLSDDGWLVCERLKIMPLQQCEFDCETTKIYGSVALDYFKKKI